MPHRPNAANGHLVRGPSGSVWFAGDTELFQEMEKLPDLAGGVIDVALVPVWGWGPRLSGGHLTPSTAAVAVAMTRARVAIPVHWGTLHPPVVARFRRGWLEQPGKRFGELVATRCPDATAIVLEPGQSWPEPA
jgi:L-ascorbate metabolism protein UlaG (beta-lactamase superfamily)